MPYVLKRRGTSWSPPSRRNLEPLLHDLLWADIPHKQCDVKAAWSHRRYEKHLVHDGLVVEPNGELDDVAGMSAEETRTDSVVELENRRDGGQDEGEIQKGVQS